MTDVFQPKYHPQQKMASRAEVAREILVREENIAVIRAFARREQDPEFKKALQNRARNLTAQLNRYKQRNPAPKTYKKFTFTFTFRWRRANVGRRRGNLPWSEKRYQITIDTENRGPNTLQQAQAKAEGQIVEEVVRYVYGRGWFTEEHVNKLVADGLIKAMGRERRRDLQIDIRPDEAVDIDLERGPGGTLWYRLDVHEEDLDHHVPEHLQLLPVDSAGAPALSGWEDFSNAQYGCVTELLYNVVQRHPKMKRQTREQIFQELLEGVLGPEGRAGLEGRYIDPCLDAELKEEEDEVALPDQDLPLPLGIAPGFTARNVIEWFKKNEAYFALSVRFPQEKETIEVPTTDVHGNYRKVELLFNNGHVYMKARDRKRAKIESERFVQFPLLEYTEEVSNAVKMEAIYATIEEYLGPEMQALINKTQVPPTRVFCEDIQLEHIATYLVRKGIMPRVSVDPPHVIEVHVHMDFAQIEFVATTQYKQREQLWRCLHETYPLQENYKTFDNKTWSQLVEPLFTLRHGQLPMSFDSLYDRDFVNQFYQHGITAGINVRGCTPSNPTSVYCVDLSKCYLNEVRTGHQGGPEGRFAAFAGQNTLIPLPTALDNWKRGSKLLESDKVAEFIVAPFEHHGLIVPQMIWHKDHVKHLLSMKLITPKHVLWQRGCKRYMTLEALVDFGEHLLATYPDCKGLYTSLFGLFGKRHNTTYECDLTTDRRLASMLVSMNFIGCFGMELPRNQQTHSLQMSHWDDEDYISGLYHEKTREEYLENNNTLFRWIVGAGNLRLFELMSIVKHQHPEANLLTVRTDSVYYELPSSEPFVLPTIDQISAEKLGFGNSRLVSDQAYKREDKMFLLPPRERKYGLDGIPWALKVRDPVESHGRAFSDNILYYGAAGSGKTRKMAQLATGRRVLNLAVMRTARNEMKVKTSRTATSQKSLTFNKLERLMETSPLSKTELREIDTVFIDEFSMMSPKHWAVLNTWVQQKLTCPDPNFQMFAFGDPNQIPPVGAPIYDILNNPGVRHLFPRIEKVPFVPRVQNVVAGAGIEGVEPLTGRYSEVTYKATQHLLETGKLSEALLDRVVSYKQAMENQNEYNVCYQHKTIERVMKERKERGVNPDRYRIIANTSKYDNGTTMTLAEIQEKNIPAAHYVHDLACTVYAIQGSTVEQPLTIWEPTFQHFSRAHLYVALTRNRGLDQITIAGPRWIDDADPEAARKKARDYLARWTWYPPQQVPVKHKMLKHRQGIIYLIKDEVGYEEHIADLFSEEGVLPAMEQRYYVGKTVRSADMRLEEHLDGGKFRATATIEVISHVNDDDVILAKVEARYIKRYALMSKDETSPFYGWECTNHQHNPLKKKKKKVPLGLMPEVALPVEAGPEVVLPDEVVEVEPHDEVPDEVALLAPAVGFEGERSSGATSSAPTGLEPLMLIEGFNARLKAIECTPIRITKKGLIWRIKRKNLEQEFVNKWDGELKQFEVIEKKVTDFVREKIDASF